MNIEKIDMNDSALIRGLSIYQVAHKINEIIDVINGACDCEESPSDRIDEVKGKQK